MEKVMAAGEAIQCSGYDIVNEIADNIPSKTVLPNVLADFRKKVEVMLVVLSKVLADF